MSGSVELAVGDGAYVKVSDLRDMVEEWKRRSVPTPPVERKGFWKPWTAPDGFKAPPSDWSEVLLANGDQCLARGLHSAGLRSDLGNLMRPEVVVVAYRERTT